MSLSAGTGNIQASSSSTNDVNTTTNSLTLAAGGGSAYVNNTSTTPLQLSAGAAANVKTTLNVTNNIEIDLTGTALTASSITLADNDNW